MTRRGGGGEPAGHFAGMAMAAAFPTGGQRPEVPRIFRGPDARDPTSWLISLAL